MNAVLRCKSVYQNCRQLDAMANMTVDGDFEAKEMKENKAKLEESLKDLDKLSEELQSASKADAKD